MKIKIGIDQVEVKKIRKIFFGHEKFLSRVYTDREIKYCFGKRNVYQHLAARFAAKEAVSKALGVGLSREIKMADIEIVRNKHGKPCLKFYRKTKELIKKKNIKEIEVSLSHCQEYAIAQVLMIEKE